jgi:hypothetical protein
MAWRAVWRRPTVAGMKTRTHLARWAALALLIAAAAPTAARAAGPAVLPPTARPYGHTYSEWAARWWQWGLTQPDAAPLFDTDGSHCADGQAGPVWFLAGSFTSKPVFRRCTVPAGRALLFPVVNTGQFEFPDDPPKDKTEAALRAVVNPPVRAATDLTATIDGVSVPDIKARYFEESVIFRFVVPAGNLFLLPEGTEVGPNADAGYYLVVPPLPVGRHTVHFSGVLPAPPDSSLTVDVTDEITVAP